MAYEYGGDPVSAMYGGQQAVAQAQAQDVLRPMQIQQARMQTEQMKVTLDQAKAILNIQQNMAHKAATRNVNQATGGVAGPRNQIEQVSNNMLEMADLYMYTSPEMAKQYVEMADKLIANQGLADERHLNTLIKDYQTFGAQIPVGAQPEYVRQVAQTFQNQRPDDARELYGGIISKIASGELPVTPDIVKMLHDGAMTGLQQSQMQLAEVHEKTAMITAKADQARVGIEEQKRKDLQEYRDLQLANKGAQAPALDSKARKAIESKFFNKGIDLDESDPNAIQALGDTANTIVARKIGEARAAGNNKPDIDKITDEAIEEARGMNTGKIRMRHGFTDPYAKKKPKGTTAGAGTPAAEAAATPATPATPPPPPGYSVVPQ